MESAERAETSPLAVAWMPVPVARSRNVPMTQSQRSSLRHTRNHTTPPRWDTAVTLTLTRTPTSPHYGTSLTPQSAADTSSSPAHTRHEPAADPRSP